MHGSRQLVIAPPRRRLSRPNAARCALGLLLAIMISAQGCTPLRSVAGRGGPEFPTARAGNPVVDIQCIWQVGDGHTPEGDPCRGFCGQLMFLTLGSPTAARIDGAVRIDVFDGLESGIENPEPFDSFEFTREQWRTFERQSKLGMTYQIFIPYRRPGRYEADCALRVAYTPAASGKPVRTDLAPINLPGKPLTSHAQARRTPRREAVMIPSSSGNGGPPSSAAAMAPPSIPAARGASRVEAIATLGREPSNRATLQRLQQMLDSAPGKPTSPGDVVSADEEADPGYGGVQQADFEDLPGGW